MTVTRHIFLCKSEEIETQTVLQNWLYMNVNCCWSLHFTYAIQTAIRMLDKKHCRLANWNCIRTHSNVAV